ncbi:MAG TPA: AgmX/PglI C-terminal domain-containing protein [Labilithrix sp.]|nr:AgmX/PglI C-terminal domain-containing protein [Labilithrix sp.]
MTRVSARATALLAAAFACGVVASCGGKDELGMVPIDPSKRQTPVAEVAELEIRAVGVDRFTVCPPPGDLGQPWFPQPGPWTAPAVVAVDAGPAESIDQDFITRTKNYTPTEQAIEATHREFRSCYRHGLVRDPAQDGRVAIVLRIGGDGRVARVEEYAACEISVESIACMKAVAARLRFPPPASGADTVLIPAVFTSRDGVRRTTGTTNDSYTARAYITMEAARPGLHACEEQARRDLRPMQAAGTFTLTLGANGQVSRAHVDPWTGEQSTLACAARELEKLRFAPPPSGTGSVIARLNFNPRQGSR